MTGYRKVFSSISVLPVGDNSADTIINSISSSSSGPELSESPSANAKMRAIRKEKKSIQMSVLAPIEPHQDKQEDNNNRVMGSTNQHISEISTSQEITNVEAPSWEPKIQKAGRKRRVVDSDDETPRHQHFAPNEVQCMGTASQPDSTAPTTDEFSLDPIITSSFIEGDLETAKRSQSPRCEPGNSTIQNEEDTTLVSNNSSKLADQNQMTGTLSSFLTRLQQMEAFIKKRQKHMRQELEASEVDRKQIIDIISQTQEILSSLMPDKAQIKAQQKNSSNCMHLGP
ncbi:hypothetical protein KL919_003270 [Ogataea angusta]|uniref:Uncharacterized protein n=1 Tax=Pichia angusta TaxID=870730 RepID=A0AAN6DF28_PICAN|nr:uncharacterized protein KL928_003436 [Ogataea angusta]KAG7817537.1 hypothetical protein KL928_003436 [Ogataea angusta]KAG7818435.1 hypothetical protein KL909_005057 [Ogataea angusta]KAG7833860.1 hypothetical protein KL943_003968 [Ogataea angusta]KAG7845498.1 hypothetical protein KL941_003344 [Ogataea angusta]KAG7854178.1 hypothetical protein KL939_005153 [Ogataea angusta]